MGGYDVDSISLQFRTAEIAGSNPAAAPIANATNSTLQSSNNMTPVKLATVNTMELHVCMVETSFGLRSPLSSSVAELKRIKRHKAITIRAIVQ